MNRLPSVRSAKTLRRPEWLSWWSLGWAGAATVIIVPPPESRRDGFLLASSGSGCVLSRESECEEFSGYRRSEVVQQRQGIRVYRSR